MVEEAPALAIFFDERALHDDVLFIELRQAIGEAGAGYAVGWIGSTWLAIGLEELRPHLNSEWTYAELLTPLQNYGLRARPDPASQTLHLAGIAAAPQLAFRLVGLDLQVGGEPETRDDGDAVYECNGPIIHTVFDKPGCDDEYCPRDGCTGVLHTV